MKYDEIIEEIKRANKNIYQAYISLNYLKAQKQKKYFDYCIEYITEADEILSNLEIYIELEKEKKENEQL